MFQKTDSQNECNPVSSFGINYDNFHIQSPNFPLSEENSFFDDWQKENQMQTPNSQNYAIKNEIENTINKGVIQDPQKIGEDNNKDKININEKNENEKISDIKSEKIAFSNKKNHLQTIQRKTKNQMKMIQQVEVVNLLMKRKRRKKQIKKT